MKVVLAGTDIIYGSFLQLVAKELENLSPMHMDMGACYNVNFGLNGVLQELFLSDKQVDS